MAEKGSKKKKSKADANVLASLPKTRPNKLGRRGREGAETTASERSEVGAAKGTRAKPTAAKAVSAASKAKAKAKPKAKAKARKPKAAPALKAAPKAVVAEATPKRPKPVRAASANLKEPAEKSADNRAPAPDKSQSGTELVSTVVQAAGELASVGLSIGGQIVKRAVDRLPKP